MYEYKQRTAKVDFSKKGDQVKIVRKKLSLFLVGLQQKVIKSTQVNFQK